MQQAVSLFSRSKSRYLTRLLLLLLMVIVCAVFDLAIGASYIAPRTVLQALFDYDPGNFSHRVVIELRLLRLVAALLIGTALGVAGLLLQSVIRNPLGEPHILGLNAGAALAVVLSTASGAGWLISPAVRPLVAAAGAALLFSLVITFSSAGRSGLTVVKVTLCGVALSAFASSLSATVLILDEQTLMDMRTWLAGDLAGLSWPVITAAAILTGIAMLLATWQAPSLNMLALGDHLARGLGVNLQRTRLFSIIAIALLSGAAVSIAGPIGFVGLIVPHIIRRLVTEDLRRALPCCALGGALVLLVADIAARTLIAPQELATGVMTALAGAPVFIFIASRFFK
ncbi:FecCD family ABC transporter permease [Dryocola sp. BD586]|uniref:FecCD family ABC transporter permease n=1 Tax=Dryocola sp. BD586 TaxID=3133271 RepID=UPI003F4FF9C2